MNTAEKVLIGHPGAKATLKRLAFDLTVSSLTEEVPTFIWREELADFGECVKHLIECSGSNSSKMGLRSGE